MTNAIEQAKQSMYKWLEAAKKTAHCSEHSISMKWMEECLEAYLEELRLDHEALHVTARERFDSIRLLERANEELREEVKRLVSLDGTNRKLSQCLATMTKERDEIQGRLHAVDHAYAKSQEALSIAGDAMRDMQMVNRSCQAEMKLLHGQIRMRDEIIDALPVEHLRGSYSQGHTSPQDSKENRASEQPDAKALMIVLGALVDAQRIVTDYLVPDGIRAKRAMEKLIPFLDNKDLVKAQKVFEKRHVEDPCAHDYRNQIGCPECGQRFA